MQQKNTIKYYFSLVKFQHTIFAFPFAIFGYFIAILKYGIDYRADTLILIILCMVFARNAAMAFNRFIDRKIDKKNPRTKNREIPAKKISPKASVIFTVTNSVLFVSTTYFINDLCFYLSPIALFVVFFYSYTKRFTGFSHFVLGLSLAIAPTGAFIAASGFISISVIILSIIVLFWTSGFDIIYSLQDEEFDRKNKLFSIPALFGKRKALLISRIVHFLCSVFCIILGIIIEANIIYWMSVIIFSILLFYQHIIIRGNDNSKIKFAFAYVNGFAGIIYSSLSVISLVI